MHPPFGFALFYLRSVAPSKEYTDKLTKKLIKPVTTMQIYWGAVPFVLIQIIMVGLIIFFPGIVSSGLDKEEKVDLNKVMLQMEADMPAAEAAKEDKVDAAGKLPTPAADDKAPDDDPMKAMQDAMNKDKK
jgi:GntP family gluconate:H+ symporter